MGFLIGAICVGQILAQVGAFSVPALLPSLMSEWSLSNTEAGWVTGFSMLDTRSRCRSWCR